jgi:hypothetical protein
MSFETFGARRCEIPMEPQFVAKPSNGFEAALLGDTLQ